MKALARAHDTSRFWTSDVLSNVSLESPCWITGDLRRYSVTRNGGVRDSSLAMMTWHVGVPAERSTQTSWQQMILHIWSVGTPRCSKYPNSHAVPNPPSASQLKWHLTAVTSRGWARKAKLHVTRTPLTSYPRLHVASPCLSSLVRLMLMVCLLTGYVNISVSRVIGPACCSESLTHGFSRSPQSRVILSNRHRTVAHLTITRNRMKEFGTNGAIRYIFLESTRQAASRGRPRGAEPPLDRGLYKPVSSGAKCRSFNYFRRF
jgi:hypothetical protein